MPQTICLYAPISSADEYSPVDLTPLKRLRATALREFDRQSWRWAGQPSIHFDAWHVIGNSNRGDIAIRLAIQDLLSEQFGPDTTFIEVGWGKLTPEVVADINARCTLFVVCGGGYIFMTPEGELRNRRIVDDLVFLPTISCRKIALGIGVNLLLGDSDVDVGELRPSARTIDTLRQFSAAMDAISVRGWRARDLLIEACARDIPLIGDPALFLSPSESGYAGVPGRTNIGLNVAMHGHISASRFPRIFTLFREVLASLPKDRFAVHYFVHSTTERIAVEMFAASGHHFSVVDSGPRDLVAGYRAMDVVLCQMLHASILSSNACTPSLSIPYDIKSFGFYDLLGMPNHCLSGKDVTAQAIVDRLEAILLQRQSLSKQLAATKADLKTRTRAHLDAIFATCA